MKNDMTPMQRCAVSLVGNGYRVIHIEAGQKRPSQSNWQHSHTRVKDVATWPKEGGVGVLTEHTPAVDLDILDEELAAEMQEFVLGFLGAAPVRVGRAPKRLMVFQASEPFTKITSASFVSPDGATHRVEILGKGQQFVAYGVHPDTVKPYKWVSQDSPLTADVLDLPVLNAEDATLITAEFERLAVARGWEKKAGPSAAKNGASDDLDFLRPKPDVSESEVKAALSAMPGAENYDDWVRVGMALHHQYDGGEEGLGLWHQWSSTAANYDPGVLDKKWLSFGSFKGRKTTFGFVLKATKESRAELHKSEATAEAKGKREHLRLRILQCPDGDALIDDVLPEIVEANLDGASEKTLLAEIDARRKELRCPVLGLRVLTKQVRALREAKGEKKPGIDLDLEVRLAEKVMALYFGDGRHLKYISKAWWVYDDGLWRRTDDTMIECAVMRGLRKIRNDGDEDVAALCSDMNESRGDKLNALTTTITSVLQKSTAEDGAIDPLNLCALDVPMVVNCPNGEIWVKPDGSFDLSPHKASHRLTSMIGCEYAPSTPCPTWDKALRLVFSRCENPGEMARHLLEVFGYALQPTRHQAIWAMLKGPGRNGKSFLLTVISAVMGSGAVLAHSIADIANGAGTHFADSLQGKLMLLDDDLKSDTILPDDWLKKLSEAKLVTANPKFGKHYNFIARSLPVILTNSWPGTRDLSDGIRRRAMVFEMSHKLEESEINPNDLPTILRNELPGVLNQLLAGLRRFVERGQRFDVPAECAASAKAWLFGSNATARFVGQVIDVTGSRHDFVLATTVYDAYRNWIRYGEHNAKELGRNKFYTALEAMGLWRVNRSGVVGYSKIRLRMEDWVSDTGGFLDLDGGCKRYTSSD